MSTTQQNNLDFGTRVESIVGEICKKQGEILYPTTQEQNFQGADRYNDLGFLIDIKGYEYLLPLQYNKEKNYCSVPRPFHVDSISTHVYVLNMQKYFLARNKKNDYFLKFFVNETDVINLRNFAKELEGRCDESEYLIREGRLIAEFNDKMRPGYVIKQDHTSVQNWCKLKIIKEWK